MANFSSCSGIMIHSKAKVLIDMNMGGGELPGLLLHEKPDAAIISHYHLDHSVWSRYVGDHSNARILIPKKEEPYLTSLDYIISHTAGPFGMADQWQRFVVDERGYRALDRYECYSSQTSFHDLAPEMVVVETPGHSPGHSSFYFPDEKILFSGDVGLDRFGPWYGWEDCDIKALVDSILRLDGMDVGLVLTSHGGVITKGIHNAFGNAVRHILTREKRIMERLDQGISKPEIIGQGVFYTSKNKAKLPMKSFLDMWDTAMYQHHEALIREGGLMRIFPEIKGMLV